MIKTMVTKTVVLAAPRFQQSTAHPPDGGPQGQRTPRVARIPATNTCLDLRGLDEETTFVKALNSQNTQLAS